MKIHKYILRFWGSKYLFVLSLDDILNNHVLHIQKHNLLLRLIYLVIPKMISKFICQVWNPYFFIRLYVYDQTSLLIHIEFVDQARKY